MKRIYLALAAVASVVALSIITSPPAYPSQSVPSYSTLVTAPTVAESPACGDGARAAIDQLYTSMGYGGMVNPYPQPPCDPEPADKAALEECRDKAKADFNDKIDDAKTDSDDRLTSAAITGEIEYAIVSYQMDNANTLAEIAAACEAFEAVRKKADKARWDDFAKWQADVSTALGEYATDMANCCDQS